LPITRQQGTRCADPFVRAVTVGVTFATATAADQQTLDATHHHAASQCPARSMQRRLRTLVVPCWVGKSSTATLRWAARRRVGLPMQTHRLAVVIDKTTCAKIKTTITANLYSALVPMKSVIEIAIFPSGKLRRPKEKLETIARQEVLARMAALSTDGMAV
jgi:hypothetical protein